MAAARFTLKGKWLWIAQRVTAVVLLVDAVISIFWWVLHPSFGYLELRYFLTSIWGALGGSAVMIALAVHGGIGMWAVGTDYITPAQMGPVARLLLPLYNLLLCVLLPLVIIIYGLGILWLN